MEVFIPRLSTNNIARMPPSQRLSGDQDLLFLSLSLHDIRMLSYTKYRVRAKMLPRNCLGRNNSTGRRGSQHTLE